MRPHQCTLSAAHVYAHARRLMVAELELRDYKQAVPATVLASVLLLAACWQTSLSAACQLVNTSPSHESVRKALHACLPRRPRALLERLLALLRHTLPDHLDRTPRVFVLDLHQRPFYGSKKRKGTSQRQAKKGTKTSFTYATLAILSPAGRFTVALLPVPSHMRLTTIVERLFAQAKQAGVPVAYLLADKEFYAAEVIDWLQRHHVPFIVPAKRRGKQGGNQHLFRASTEVGWDGYTWTAPLRRHDFATGKKHKRGTLTVQVSMCVTRHQKRPERLVYACWGLNSKQWSAAQVREAYRRRFGIEVSYRQLGQCLAKTSSGNERVRLLLVGMALFLCNLWSWLHSEVFATGPVSERCCLLHRARLRVLLAGLVAVLTDTFGGYRTEWMTQRPLPSILTIDQE